VLDRADLSPAAGRLTADGFAWHMLIAHEQQHNETMLQTLRLAEPGVYSPPVTRELPAEGSPLRDTVHVPGGPFLMGDSGDGFAYDNERPRHEVDVPGFDIHRVPVTNADYMEFVDAGGYARREWWSDAGWAWRAEEGIERPLYWTADGRERRFDRVEALRPDLPVMHVSFHEAEAYARSLARRLPTADDEVLRGGSWATRPNVMRNTFRNWDYPQRRQIFSGFRCAAS